VQILQSRYIISLRFYICFQENCGPKSHSAHVNEDFTQSSTSFVWPNEEYEIGAMCRGMGRYTAEQIHPLLLEIPKEREWPLNITDLTAKKVEATQH
jgi:hypothetical protein